MLRRWRLYLNRCVDLSALESFDALGCQAPFSMDPTMADMEGGRYAGLILPMALRDLVSRASGRGGRGDVDGTSEKQKYSTTGGARGCGVRYDMNLPALNVQDRGNPRSILERTALPTLHGAVLCKNCHLCGSCWEDCERK